MRSFVILLLMTVSADAAIECHKAPPSVLTEFWAWRTIDGQKCWYAGARGLSKSLLFWPKPVKSEPAPEPVSAPPVVPEPEPVPDPSVDFFRDRWAPVERK